MEVITSVLYKICLSVCHCHSLSVCLCLSVCPSLPPSVNTKLTQPWPDMATPMHQDVMAREQIVNYRLHKSVEIHNQPTFRHVSNSKTLMGCWRIVSVGPFGTIINISRFQLTTFFCCCCFRCVFFFFFFCQGFRNLLSTWTFSTLEVLYNTCSSFLTPAFYWCIPGG